MKRIILILAIFTHSLLLRAQITNNIPSSSSIANTGTADTQHWTSFNNPAMIGYLEKPELGLQFENRYLISELSTKSVQLGLTSKFVNTGLSFSHFGFSLYHEMVVGIGFARNFSNNFAMGVQFNYYSAYFSASNSYRGALFPQVGLSVKLNPNFSLGFNAFNPFQSNIQTDFTLKRLPSVFSFGSEYFFAPELSWRAQIDKEVSSNYRFATGFDYRMLQSLSIKLGAYNSDYLVPCIGFGWHIGSVLFDLNCELHPLLGLNSMAAVKYRFDTH